MSEVPGSQKSKLIRDPNNLIEVVVNTVDDVLDDLVGMRPVEAVVTGVRTIAPANVLNNVTGVPKPSEKVTELVANMEGNLRSAKGRLPNLPKPF